MSQIYPLRFVILKTKTECVLFMKEDILDELNNVPYNGEDANKELTECLEILADFHQISKMERERLDYELEKIKQWGIAKVFLFGKELCNLKLGAILAVENYSYINYLLNAANVNACLYNLPFERLFNEYRLCLPNYNLYIKKGKKGEVLKKLYENYGKSTIVRASDNVCMYYFSSKPFEPKFIKERAIIANQNEEAYEENVSCLTFQELYRLGYYNVSLIEVEDISYSDKKCFEEDVIYEKTKELFAYKILDTPSFSEIEDINEILKDIEYKLIYQEQVIEILNKICGFDLSKADYFRRELAKAKRATTEELKNILTVKYGNAGENLYEYLIKITRYTVQKAYVIANLHVKVDY